MACQITSHDVTEWTITDLSVVLVSIDKISFTLLCTEQNSLISHDSISPTSLMCQ